MANGATDCPSVWTENNIHDVSQTTTSLKRLATPADKDGVGSVSRLTCDTRPPGAGVWVVGMLTGPRG